MKASNIPSATSDANFRYQIRNDPKSSHNQIAALVRRLKRGPILDVGAAEGFLGRLLRQKESPSAPNLVLDAIEPNISWSEDAKPFYRHVFASSVEDANLPAHEYQVIVCADVLEHVTDPIGVLRRLQEAATPDAQFIVSLPNVAHFAIRLLLLSGQFPKMEKGILDRTHLHFYTQKTAKEMLEDAGLKVERVIPTVVPLEIWFAPGTTNSRSRLSPLHVILKQSQYAALRLAPKLFAYQWIFIARHKP